MRKLFLILIILLTPDSDAMAALKRTVSNLTDDTAEGTLRVILQDACDTKGDDEISFANTRDDEVRIELKTPLVILDDCQGKITLTGRSDADIILSADKMATDGGAMQGDSCILHVYSSGNTISHFSFGGNDFGAGICLFGDDNTLDSVRVGVTLAKAPIPNRYGVVVTDVFQDTYEAAAASGSIIKNSLLQHNDSDGVYIRANDVTLVANEIMFNGGCPEGERLEGHPVCALSEEARAVGIFIEPDYQNILIGGNDVEDGNTIRFNRDGGIWVSPDAQKILMSHNLVSRNYGDNPFIDLGLDGLTLNDPDDEDEGANGLLNFIDYAQAFPLVNDLEGNARYFIYGFIDDAVSVQVYQVHDDDVTRGYTHGGGDEFFAEANVYHDTFAFEDTQLPLNENDYVTFLAFKDDQNSEYAMNIIAADDRDLDGLPDDIETGDGTVATEATDAGKADSDGDGLPDVFEDKNRNGKWDDDLGETSAFIIDCDADGMNDYIEMRGDATYDPAIDTNPLVRDTDGDGILDGAEDVNENGVIEVYLGETNPLVTDTDGDGVSDGEDNCPALYNAGQEDYC